MFEVPTENARERTVLTGMIVSSVVLGKLAPRWEARMFASRYANLIAGWCIKHFQKYSEAPKKAIITYFELWAKASQDRDTIQLISDFLSSLSEEHEVGEELNNNLVIDRASEHFNAVRLQKFKDVIEGCCLTGETDKAKVAIGEYKPFDFSGDYGVDVFNDKEAIAEPFRIVEVETLITYGGALGRFFRDAFSRDSFVALMAPEKAGKTWMLIDIAWRAMIERRKVSFFEVGDMSYQQLKRRLYSRAAKCPWRSETGEWPYVVKRPSKLTVTKDGPQVEYDRLTFPGPLNYALAEAACEKITREKLKSNQSHFRLSVSSNSSINVMGIREIVEVQISQGFIPDVIVIDYADILADPLPSHVDHRTQINTTWKQLRKLSQDFHCLVVTATQSDAASYDKKTLGMGNFSEDKRKHSHVTGTFGINVTPTEKERGVMRLNWIVRREGEYNSHACVSVAGCLALGDPCIRSVMS